MTLKIGWIGCGIHATQMLLPQLVRHDVEIVALCDIDGKRLGDAGRQFGVARLTSDAEELIRTPGIDAIGMAVGPDQHLHFGKLALDRGLPVFMEKPPSGTAAGARELRAASERAGKPLLVGFMKRYSVGNKIAHNIIKSGRFGPVLGLTGYYMTAPGYFTGNVDYTGFFLHHCVHYMDLVSFFVSPVRTISARKVEKTPGRLLFHVGFEFECGAIGNIAMGTIQSRGTPVERIELMGDHQRLEVDDVIEVRWNRNPPFKVDDPEATLADDVDTLTWKPNFTAAANEDPKGYYSLLADVVPALGGASTAAPTIHDGVIAMERLETLRRELDL
ncbi:myo-inositol 2-dehydrogenase/D-chiro-inositol 1-dehydrogenase [Phyllobacterium trifolii]|jgi:myo-inositol 2-dehydrogenase/D-chiro-inositol 1-dehydrogenase|uniref:Myo-inositol 2-dehydrogenase/D-chiro-inositol 1-dehydrogenase n=1 Tax=Phyllobacterium trifolii TaxID=300193 RepID=A0A839UAD6_9HYPH|nr:Gfo/Idh/MocA family oxidoreductase [Phyllobacterium trifolii]MBB3147497.1 myo-inositol 2-dehydrogenase/D-chiro-inositol 1-dehydrogenase [Phyllobacterium trifolii]